MVRPSDPKSQTRIIRSAEGDVPIRPGGGDPTPAGADPAGADPAEADPAGADPGGTTTRPPRLNLFLGGDSGYGPHFQSIGRQYGPFDLAFLECGQYGVHWPYIHMFPEETVLAAADLKARSFFPVHWAKFTLSLHPWNEPIRRVVAEAKAFKIPVTTPRIGAPVIINHDYPSDPWYELNRVESGLQ
jgi:L-ascorbate metabolism protein UlaG (beta-lactamase superfamily)